MTANGTKHNMNKETFEEEGEGTESTRLRYQLNVRPLSMKQRRIFVSQLP